MTYQFSHMLPEGPRQSCYLTCRLFIFPLLYSDSYTVKPVREPLRTCPPQILEALHDQSIRLAGREYDTNPAYPANQAEKTLGKQ